MEKGKRIDLMKVIVINDDCDDCPYFSFSDISYRLICNLQTDEFGYLGRHIRYKKDGEYFVDEVKQELLKDCPLKSPRSVGLADDYCHMFDDDYYLDFMKVD